MTADGPHIGRPWQSYRLRWKRRYLLGRAIRRRGQLSTEVDRTAGIRADDILLFSTMRNEVARIPHFLDYYRRLGVGHFLVVENDSTDETADLLARQPDVSLWRTARSYKAARFGMDWLTWLQFRFGHGHWSVTVDADELLTFPHAADGGLNRLTRWLEERSIASFGAVMVDMYPKGRLDAGTYRPGDDPVASLGWFDADNFFATPRRNMNSQVLRGGVRLRAFFADQPERAPTMNKVPLVHWNRRSAYLSSTHVILPPRLNMTDDDAVPSGALLHTKFLPGVSARAREEKARGEHFANSSLYLDYYDRLASGGSLWSKRSREYIGWEQLVELGLMRLGMYGPAR